MSHQKVWRLWEKGAEEEESEGESGCKEDEEGGGEGEDEDVGGEDAEADGQRVDPGQGCSGLEVVAIWMQTRLRGTLMVVILMVRTLMVVISLMRTKGIMTPRPRPKLLRPLPQASRENAWLSK